MSNVQLREQKAKIAELKAQLAELKAKPHTAEEIVIRLQAKLRGKDGEIIVQKIRLEDQALKIACLEKRATDRSKAFGDMVSRSNAKDIKISDLSLQVEWLDDKVVRRADAYRCLNEKLKRVQGNLNHEMEMVQKNTNATIDALVSQVDTLDEDKKELQAEVKVLNDKIGELRGAVIVNNETFRMIENQIKARNSEILTMTGEIHSLRTQIDARKSPRIVCCREGGAVGCPSVREKNEQIADLEVKLAACHTARKGARKRIDELERKIRQGNITIGTFEVRCNAYNDAYIKTLAKVEKLERVISDLETLKRGGDAAFEADERRIAELIRDCGCLRHKYNVAGKKIRELEKINKRLQHLRDKSRKNFNTVRDQLHAFKTGPIPFDIIELRQEVAANKVQITMLQREIRKGDIRVGVKEIEIEELKLQVKRFRYAAAYSPEVSEGLVLKVERLAREARDLHRKQQGN